MALRIEDYALIGDCETAALVAKDGSIDWLCWPRFDSDACFAALLGTPENGRWKIAPSVEHVHVRRQYRDSTLILETDFETPDGAVTLIDFMPLRETQSDLVRIVRGRRGKVSMHMDLALRFDYGSGIPWVTKLDDGALRAIAGPHMTILRTPVELRGENMRTIADFTVNAGDEVPFVLTYSPSHLELPQQLDASAAEKKTEKFWEEWTGRCGIDGPYANAIRRSLITLKALTYAPTGGIVAAATTSLPEKLGGERNWDYRICWLRDASFALFVLMRAGYLEEASDWQDWLMRAVAGSPDQVQVMYGLAGERRLTELEIPWLPGYEKSTPVRIGNAATEQFQLDIYGEILSMMHFARQEKLPHDEATRDLEIALLNHLEKVWREPDEGIWEVRGGRRHFTHSKVMAWVAFDRAIKGCEEDALAGDVDRWRSVRQEIHDDVCKNAFDPELDTFVQSYGSKIVDASLLMIAKVRFLPPGDPRVIGTVRAIERDLMVDGFVMRYNTKEVDDGLPPGEGAFLACTFWLADNYQLMGREREARELLDRLLKLQNEVGLLSEQYDLTSKRLIGNFPQAFSHVALINTAINLSMAAEQPAISSAPAKK
jgi:GH15 family glucan-1,4-alpha-glucosidase